MSAYYNENEPFAAEWLRQLIKAGLIAPGEVDERNIQQVEPDDLREFTQCHFFAGIGVWSYALRAAGWPDDLGVWTGSCPCQGFSASGKREGFSDQRHLWPAWFRLIRECSPHVIFGEQVASKDGLAWFDVVSSDLEGEGYAIGAVDTCAAGFGAPHIRSRLYFVADANFSHAGAERLQRSGEFGRTAEDDCVLAVADARRRRREQRDAGFGDVQLADANGAISSVGDSAERGLGMRGSASGNAGRAALSGEASDVEHSEQPGMEGHNGNVGNGDESGRITENETRSTSAPSLTNGFWAAAEWLWCRDQKYRPVETGTFPLAHGVAKRVGKLRGFGNALVAPQAQGFIEAYLGLC